MYYFYLRCYLIHMTQNGSLYKKPFSCTTFYLRYDLTFKVSPYQRPYISGVKRKYCLTSYNSGLKNNSNKNNHIFRKPDGIPWTKQILVGVRTILKVPDVPNFPIWEKSVCVCIVLVPFGPFPQRINGKSLKLDVWALSVIFFCKISHCLW